MTARAESILDAVNTLIQATATAGANTIRARAWPISALPACTVSKGADTVSDASDELGVYVRELEVNIEISTQITTNLETSLHGILAECYAAMRADPTLGLAYVFQTEPAGETAPIIEDTQETPLASMVSAWLITYEHSYTSLEA